MDQESLKEKYLQLIKATKEFLLLKKEEENSIAVVSLIRNARISESLGKNSPNLRLKIPDNVQQLIENKGNLEEAEKAALERVNELRTKMNVLSSRIRKLSIQIDPVASLGLEKPTVESENKSTSEDIRTKKVEERS